MVKPELQGSGLDQVWADGRSERRLRLIVCLPFLLGLLVAAILSICRPGLLYWILNNRDLKPGESSITLGLDLKGGARLTLYAAREPHLTQERFVTLLQQVQQLLRNRVATFGNIEPNIWIDNSGHIFLELPGIQDRAAIEKIVGKTGRLDFVLLAEGSQAHVRPGALLDAKDNVDVIASKEDVQDFSVETDAAYRKRFDITLDTGRAQEIQQKLAQHHGRVVALALSREVQEVVTIDDKYHFYDGEKIGNRISITAPRGLTEESALAYERLFRWDSLPLELEERERQLIGPQTGSESLASVRIAALLGGAAILILMLVMYGSYLGTAACIALLYGALLMWGVLSAFGTVLTLAGVAGLLLDIGVFVDSFIITFESVKDRIRERQAKGLAAAFDEDTVWDSIQHSAKHLTSLRITALISGFVLFLSPGPVRAFAVSLILGVVIETVVASRLVLGALLLVFKFHGENVSRATYGQPLFRGAGTTKTIKWTVERLPLVAAGSSLIALSMLGYAILRPPPLGMELGGGTQLRIELPVTVTEATLKAALSAGEVPDLLSLQSIIPASRSKTRSWLVAFRPGESAARIEGQVRQAFAARRIDAGITGLWQVAPGVPMRLLLQWLLFCALSLFAVVLWCSTPWSGASVGGRRWRPALIVGIGAVHDLFIITGIVAILRLPVDTPMLMGGLFMVGYSVNDSLVLIWHLGEGGGHVGMSKPQRTVREVILGIRTRTFNIFLLMLSAILPVLVLAGGSFRGYAAVVVTGLMVGSLTSVYVVGYLLDRVVQRKPKAEQPELRHKSMPI